MARSKNLLALDIGEKRIGVAVADTGVRIALPYETIEVDGNEYKRIAQLYIDQQASLLVIGYPRNQAGEPTQQTEYVVKVGDILQAMELPVEYQDESLTSVAAEERLRSYGKPYQKSDIDKHAAALILQDYLEQHYGR